MKRRSIIKFAALAGIGLSASAHTPYRQWAVYRKKHLLILTDKTRPGSFELGRQLSGILAEYLPESKARVTRAPYTQRIASLLGSKQLDVALLSRSEAIALAEGMTPFADFDPLSVRVLAESNGFVLICRDDFPDAHAYLVSKTLLEHAGTALQLRIPADQTLQPLKLHPGTLTYRQGEPLPQ